MNNCIQETASKKQLMTSERQQEPAACHEQLQKRHESIDTVQDAVMTRASSSVLIQESQVSSDDAELKEHEMHFELKKNEDQDLKMEDGEKQRNINNTHVQKYVGCKGKKEKKKEMLRENVTKKRDGRRHK